jgi:NADH:ubiquinone oxidoreductase subunit C
MHQGNQLKLLIKGKGFKMNTIAEVIQMSRQNLNYHLRKENLDDEFLQTIKKHFYLDFPKMTVFDKLENGKSTPSPAGSYQELLEGQLRFSQDVFNNLLQETLQKVKRLEVNLALVSESIIRTEATLQVNMNRVAYMEIILKNNVLDKDPARAQALKNQYDVLKKEIEQQIVDNALRIKDLTDRKAEAMTAL